ncbi:MAG: carboxyl transferase domain-containing protein [Dermatophilaceae bacterium]
MAAIRRLAIIDRGEPVMRILAAIADHNRRGRGQPITSVVLHDESRARAWYAREADEVASLPRRPRGDDPYAGPSPQDIVAAVRKADADAAWLGPVPSVADADIVDALATAEIRVVGADAATIRRLQDPDELAALGAGVGLSAPPADLPDTGWRRIQIPVVADAAGTVWTLGLRDASTSHDGIVLLCETPAPGIPEPTSGALAHAARRLTRAAAYHGVGVIELALSTDAETFWLLGFDTLSRPEHALSEEIFGRSLADLSLDLALGEHLPPEPPPSSGHAVDVRLLARDPDHGMRASGGRIELLSLPVGAGVRLDATPREGDVVDGDRDPVVATVTAWGRTRAEALDRMHAALERTSVVLERGTTNRATLLSLVEAVSSAPVPVTAGWYAGALAAGDLAPPADPLALVAGAIEAYESDSALVNAAFFAAAARGRPAAPEAVGQRVLLHYRGEDHRLRVDRTGPRTYRIRGQHTVEATVDRIGRYERRIACQGRRHRVIAVEQGADIRLEIDGVAHTVAREDGVVVRTGWPALVSSLLVHAGERVRAGQPVAVLESMKMVSTVTAPFDGTVASLAVAENTQVERGAPLLRIKPSNSDEAVVAGPGLLGEGLQALASTDAPGEAVDRQDAERVYAQIVDYLLGYDLDPERFRALLARQAALNASTAPADLTLLTCEERLIDLFADIGALYRPRTEAESLGEVGQANTQEYFLGYLQWLDADQAGLPEGYRRRLVRALGRYDVREVARTPALEAAMVWMFRSFARVPEMAPVITAILTRRLAHPQELAPLADRAARYRMERLAAATEGRQQTVADLARDVIFHFFDEPPMLAAMADLQQQVRGHLDALAQSPDRPDRAERIDALVAAAHPLRRTLLDAWSQVPADATGAAYRDVLLETYIRRFYRIRALREVGTARAGSFQFGRADYDHDGMPVHLVVAYLPLGQVSAFADAVASSLAAIAPQTKIVVDLVTWRDGHRPSVDDMADEVADLLLDCDFGRPSHRLDVTVTSRGDSDAQGHGTQHLTFRSDPDGGFAEQTLYRNLHPMLAKRLDVWRLSNFDLRRMASPEDVYLFLGVARDNPRDKRLFALAEVRDLVPVVDERTGETTYPRLGRVGLQALAAVRAALAGFPPRERPSANRLVLWVRPTWTIPSTQWPGLAAQYERLARGAGLDKLVLHVTMPVPATGGAGASADVGGSGGPGSSGATVLVPKTITLDGVGRTGLTIRLDDPGPNPVRPLTRYAQKVLTAEKFDTPYPYEIVRMLTPGPADPSPFPAGRFEELDLDADGETLVPVDRPVATNSAHLVLGLLTTYTDVVPEGMTRLAMLSDPTQGLGNLAEPECRRINAALRYAAAHHIPVEWYAVSSGALIAMDSGTENMDFIALTLRRIIEFTQGGGEINIIVTGINVGGQPYWNAESTMLMHTRGILVMTPASAMVLTGKQALDFSGAVSADDNFGIGGYDRVMGPNGQAQYWAPSFQDACLLLLAHYDYAYVVPGERFPRRRPTADPVTRDVRLSPHEAVAGTRFTKVGEVFDLATNPDRKQPFDMRSIMRAVADVDCQPIERWTHWQDADNSIVWDATVGGIPVCMLGISSRTLPRKGFVPADGPPAFTSGTLFPQASRKTARAINAASGNRPLVVMANLSGFDGSPESMRHWQLEYGAEIGRAVTNFRGPIVFVVVSRYHGGAFVVFSKALNEHMEIAAVEGSYASVIGGAPAAATVFAREVKQRTEKDARVIDARGEVAAARGPDAARLRATLAEVTATVRSEKLGEVADEFDAIHTIERALRTGSVDRIIPAEQIRPWVIDALERGMARFAEIGDA